jgi:hypothetical protein
MAELPDLSLEDLARLHGWDPTLGEPGRYLRDLIGSLQSTVSSHKDTDQELLLKRQGLLVLRMDQIILSLRRLKCELPKWETLDNIPNYALVILQQLQKKVVDG